MWIDTGDAAATTTRDAAAPITLSSRPADQAIIGATNPPSGLSVDGASRFAVSRQNDRHVIQFDTASAGIAGTWGPFGTNGNWTIILFIKMDQPVNDYGSTYMGLGRPMTLISSPGVGITIDLPYGGSVPSSALYDPSDPQQSGPIDGVLAGAPWDIPFVDHWRQLCVQNNTTTGLRSVYVDGFLINTSVASTHSIPAGTAVTIGAACPMSLSELLVWDSVSISTADIASICRAQRIKWDVPMATQPPSVTAPSTNRALLQLPAALVATPQPPFPDIWLDSTRGVYQDVAGTRIAPANGRVRMWMDHGSSANHCVFPVTARTMYGISTLDCILAKLPVVKVVSGPGVFQTNPLANTANGFTIVCIWRTVASVDGGSGHPLSGSVPASLIGDYGWVEWLGVDAARRVSLPTTVPAGTVLVGCWERTAAGQTTWRLNTLTDVGGYRWTGSVPTFNSTGPFTIASSSHGLHLAQFLMWNHVLGMQERQTVATWITNVWGIPLPTPVSGFVANVIPDAGVPALSQMALWLDATTGLYSNATAPVSYVTGGPVSIWRDRTNHHRDVSFPSAVLSVTSAINEIPVVKINSTGNFTTCNGHPLSDVGTGPFFMVGVWRVLGGNTGGGHPFNVNGKGIFALDGWQEAIGIATWRTITSVVTQSSVVLVAWSFNGTTLTHRVGSLVDGNGGYIFTEEATSLPADWTTVFNATVGTAGRTLDLAELLAWNVDLTASQRVSLDAYLRAKWQLPWTVTPSPAITASLPPREGLVTFPVADSAVLLAFGMRRILPTFAANGPIVRLRRVSDNAEIDLVSGDEPTTLIVNDGTRRTATAWAGAGVEIRIVRWYNQSSYTNNDAMTVQSATYGGYTATINDQPRFNQCPEFDGPGGPWPKAGLIQTVVTPASAFRFPGDFSIYLWVNPVSKGSLAFFINRLVNDGQACHRRMVCGHTVSCFETIIFMWVTQPFAVPMGLACNSIGGSASLSPDPTCTVSFGSTVSARPDPRTFFTTEVSSRSTPGTRVNRFIRKEGSAYRDAIVTIGCTGQSDRIKGRIAEMVVIKNVALDMSVVFPTGFFLYEGCARLGHWWLPPSHNLFIFFANGSNKGHRNRFR